MVSRMGEEGDDDDDVLEEEEDLLMDRGVRWGEWESAKVKEMGEVFGFIFVLFI